MLFRFTRSYFCLISLTTETQPRPATIRKARRCNSISVTRLHGPFIAHLHWVFIVSPCICEADDCHFILQNRLCKTKHLGLGYIQENPLCLKLSQGRWKSADLVAQYGNATSTFASDNAFLNRNPLELRLSKRNALSHFMLRGLP